MGTPVGDRDSHSFKRLIQMAYSFKNEPSACLYEWVIESLIRLIH